MHRSTRRLLAVAAVAALATTACSGVGEPTSNARDPLAELDVVAGAEFLATCTPVGGEADPNRDHEEVDTSPPADVLYADHEERPAHSGPHFGVWELPSVVEPGALADLDERSLVHNMEHGSVVVAVDTAEADAPDPAEVADLAATLVDAGFDSGNAGGAVYAVPYDLDGVPVALRAWGVALDCPTFDADGVAAFVQQHYGTRGEAPEKTLAPYPGTLLDPDESTR